MQTLPTACLAPPGRGTNPNVSPAQPSSAWQDSFPWPLVSQPILLPPQNIHRSSSMSFPGHRAGGCWRGARRASRGMSGRTEAMPGRCRQHTQGSANLKFSFGAHSLSVPGHHPSRATCHPYLRWLVAPSGVRSSGNSRRQQQTAGRSKHAWALPPCAGTHTLSSSAGAWQLHGYV